MLPRVQDGAALIGRVVLAVIFFVHGLDKLDAGIGATAEQMASMGIPLATLAALFTMAVELLGSVAFAVGLATPLVAIGYAVVGLGAIFFVHSGTFAVAEGGYEYVLALTAAAIAIGFNSGRFSVDQLLLKKVRTGPSEKDALQDA